MQKVIGRHRFDLIGAYHRQFHGQRSPSLDTASYLLIVFGDNVRRDFETYCKLFSLLVGGTGIEPVTPGL